MITIVEQLENGETETVEREIPTTDFAVKLDGQLRHPAITTNVEIENDGDISRQSDQCGNTQTRRVTNKGWTIRVQGIVTKNDGRQENLSLQLLRDVIATAESIQIRSDVISGTFEVSNVVITQANDLVSVNTFDTDGKEQAFEFQLQLGESQSN